MGKFIPIIIDILGIISAGALLWLLYAMQKKKQDKNTTPKVKAANTEADFQRWKAERKKQTREP